jgi:hypothetical protein
MSTYMLLVINQVMIAIKEESTMLVSAALIQPGDVERTLSEISPVGVFRGLDNGKHYCEFTPDMVEEWLWKGPKAYNIV